MNRAPQHAAPPPARPPRTGFARAGAAAALWLCGCSPEAPAPQGVVWISIDSLRADHLSCYGYESPTRPDLETSPAIDRLLAERGMLFERAFATTSWTLPSHVAMLSGAPNQLHGVLDLPDRIPDRLTWLPEVFADAGWRTFGVWSGPNLHPFFGFARGFDAYLDRSDTPEVGAGDVFEAADAEEWLALQELHERSHATVTGPLVAEAFETFAAGLAPDERFLAFVHLWDVHYDYFPPPEFDVFFPDYEGDVDGVGFQALNHQGAITQPDLLRWISLYDAEIRFTDEVVGRMLSALAARGRLADTLCVLTSDHGEEFAEHGAFGHKASLYEEVLRVPLVLRLDGRIPAGARTRELASLTDLAPTVAALCGLEYEVAEGGRDLGFLWDGGAPSRPAGELPIEMSLRPFGIQLVGARGEAHKVVEERVHGRDKHLRFVLDLEADPLEQRKLIVGRDVAKDDPRYVRAIEQHERLTAAGEVLGPRSGGALPDALREALERAGYLTSPPGGQQEDP